MAFRRPNTKLRTIQRFITTERNDQPSAEVQDVLDCIEAIIFDRYTIRKVTEEKLIDLDTMEPVERYSPSPSADLRSSIQTAHGRVPSFGRP